MGRNLGLLLVLLLAVGGLGYLLFGGGSDRAGDDLERGGETPGASDLATLPGDGDAPAGGPGDGRDAEGGPVLFGRPMRREKGPGALSGKVIDASTGLPVGEARVLLTGTGFGDESVLLRVETGEDGNFRLGDVPAGEGYDVRVEAEDLPVRVLAASVERGALTALGTIWLGAAGGLEGRVVGPDGRAIAGAEVRVHEGRFDFAQMMSDFMEMLSTLDREPPFVARMLTDRGGAFRFEELAPGSVTLTVNAPGFTQGRLTTVVSDDTTTARPLLVRLDPGLVVSGRVLDESGRGVAAARLAVISGNEPDAFLYGRTFSETASDGAFRVDTVRARGEVQILCTATGYPTIFHEAQPGDTSVEIVLRRGATVDLQFLSEPDDAPLAGASVLVAVGQEEGLGSSGPGSLVSGHTDAEGRVLVTTPTGHLQMLVLSHAEQGTGMWMAGRGMAVPGLLKGPKDVTVKPGGNAFVFRMPRRRVIEGRVTGPDGAPVAGARVSTAMMMPGAMKPVLTDADGRYRLVVPPMGGMAMIAVRAEGYVQDPASMTASVASSDGAETVQHDVKLERAAIVTGRVTSPAGRPVSGARVRLLAGEGGGMAAYFTGMLGGQEAITGKDGRYVLDGARPGTKVRVVGRHPDFIDSAGDEFDVAGGETQRAGDLRMQRGSALVVYVEAPNGTPLAGARVELSFNRDDDVTFDALERFQDDASRTTDASGRVEADAVPPGEVTVTASHEKHASTKTTVKVEAGAERTFEARVRLRPAMAVSGRVVDEGGAPLKGARVAVSSAGDPGLYVGYSSDTTDADGRFRLDGLPDGAVALRVTLVGYDDRTVEQRGATSDLEIALLARDPAVVARQEALTKEMQEAFARVMAAENDAEREAAQEEVRRIQKELSELTADADPDAARPVESD